MSVIETICNAGCGQPFTIAEMPTAKLDGGIEKTYFTCPHCQHQYAGFYTDAEIRALQEKIRKVLGRRVNPNILHASMVRQELKIRKQADNLKKLIAEKMDELRKGVEAK